LVLLNKLKKISPLNKEAIERIEKGEELDEFLTYAKKLIEESRKTLSELITPEIIEKIEKSREIRLKKTDEGFKLIVADPRGYLQASGRTSRMYVGGMSKGLCVILVDDEKAFFGLQKRVAYYVDEFEVKEYDEASVKETLKKVDEE
jgi:reverse gyrase